MSDAADRVKRLNRILKVQAQKRLLEEWRIGQLREQRAALEKSDAEILASLDIGNALHGLFLGAKVNNLRRNETERQKAVAEESAVEARLRDVRRVEKSIEKVRDRTKREAGAEAEAEQRDASIDAFLARTASSFE
ncbi:hypothetical protein LQ948_01495 [Jiella sp. MQZ9-1]|uniref:Flagellar FliJ protein n=1 Tax=Jiella flava TaxID=2816857 RepID=A0A939JUB0_9HYPH|nr:hypothetical protein [Jiella flava]MBO0661234.1 hypothetical protein [Jiella flava]MCD2469879.1 hypothetical protein [Jiella flava]